MEINDLFSIICFSIPILIILVIIFLVIAFLIIRGIIKKTRRNTGIPEGAGKVIREQLANFDQYIQNDKRQTQQWQSTGLNNAPALDLDDIDLDEGEVAQSRPSHEGYEPLPNWTSDSMACSSCGAPQQPNDRVCSFCGHKH